MWAALSLLCAGAWLLSARATAELTVNAIGTWEKAGLRALGAPEEEQGAGVVSRDPDRETGPWGPRVCLVQATIQQPSAFSALQLGQLGTQNFFALSQDIPACSGSFRGLGPQGSPCLGC